MVGWLGAREEGMKVQIGTVGWLVGLVEWFEWMVWLDGWVDS